jgi:ribosome maturation factor RimP
MSSGTDKIRALAEPVTAELGLEVLDIELQGSAPRQVLRIYLDSCSQGRPVTVADCEAVSRRLGDVLDANDVVAGRYMLEVSSPGVNRPLKKADHFQRVIGGRVRVRMRAGAAVDGMRNAVGRLVAFDGQTLVVETDDARRLEVALEEIEKANFEHEFPKIGHPKRRR